MSPDLSARQLPLSIPMDTDMTRQNWLSREGTAALESWLFDEAGSTYVRGESGLGKSHLLQAVCQSQPGSLYLPMGELLDMPPMALLEGTEGVSQLAIDDLEKVAGHPEWHEALFHLYNRALQTGLRLVVASTLAPAAIPGLLPDLRSRLESLPVFVLPKFDEPALDGLLALRAMQRGFTLTPEVRAYLLKRVERSPEALMQMLDRLDREGLAHARAITIPLLREIRFPTPDR